MRLDEHARVMHEIALTNYTSREEIVDGPRAAHLSCANIALHNTHQPQRFKIDVLFCGDGGLYTLGGSIATTSQAAAELARDLKDPEYLHVLPSALHAPSRYAATRHGDCPRPFFIQSKEEPQTASVFQEEQKSQMRTLRGRGDAHLNASPSTWCDCQQKQCSEHPKRRIHEAAEGES